MPRKKPPTSSDTIEVCPARPTNSTGTIVESEMSGNMIRPPNRSVNAPTGIRPSDPTMTGTATIRACWDPLRPSRSLKRGPSGLSSAHAQKLTAKPTVASTSMRRGGRGQLDPSARASLRAAVLMSVPVVEG